MRVFILGIDGYLGWSLANHLAGMGKTVGGVDNLARRQYVEEMGSVSAIPIPWIWKRKEEFSRVYGYIPDIYEFDITESGRLSSAIRDFRPDAIVHFAECPSAPYSMQSVFHAGHVQLNNVIGTLNLLFAMRDYAPDAHLVKLGTMGEYGTPNIDIPEGYFEIEYRGRTDRLPFPKQAGSFYHLSKVHDTNNIAFACKMWNLRATDIMQGVVYGTRYADIGTVPTFRTRLDFDEAFGTAINRFCCQVVAGEPMTIYGSGGQTRGFLPLRESIECLTLALENPAGVGEHRVFNQFAEAYSILDLAITVRQVAEGMGLEVRANAIDNPRIESEDHYYEPDRWGLEKLGYKPNPDIHSEIAVMIEDLLPHKDRIAEHRDVLMPEIKWSGE